MKAWRVQDKDGEMQEIVFADTRHKAIYKSEANGWTEYINVRAKRAKFADGLEDKPKKLTQVMLENGWYFECGKCLKQVDIDTLMDLNKNVSEKGEVVCDTCFNENVTAQSVNTSQERNI